MMGCYRGRTPRSLPGAYATTPETRVCMYERVEVDDQVRYMGESGTSTPIPSGGGTRSALLNGGRVVFEECGLHDARIVDITRRARCSVGSFYTYFSSKEELFHCLLVELEDEVYNVPDRLSADARPIDRILETNRLYLGSFRRNAAFWSVVEQAAVRNPEARRFLADRHHYHRTRTYGALSRWQQEGQIPPGIDLWFAATALGAMTERCAYLWFVLNEPCEFDEAVDQITKLWANALGLVSSTDNYFQ